MAPRPSRSATPTTFEPTGSVQVTAAGQPVAMLNELECVDGEVWANVWETPYIVRIDPATGMVTGVLDMTGCRPRPVGDRPRRACSTASPTTPSAARSCSRASYGRPCTRSASPTEASRPRSPRHPPRASRSPGGCAADTTRGCSDHRHGATHRPGARWAGHRSPGRLPTGGNSSSIRPLGGTSPGSTAVPAPGRMAWPRPAGLTS